ncbi:MAG: hypothetical protein RLY14_1092 [Planctomycetota bacterium]|jgi:hypothetical protein
MITITHTNPQIARFHSIVLLTILPVALEFATSALAQNSHKTTRETFSSSWDSKHFPDMKLLLCFQGKGSCLPYDAGVLEEAYAQIPAIRNRQTIVAGNSSGAIPAAFFCCFGFTDQNVKHAISRLVTGDRSAVRNMENVNTKISKISRGQSTEIPHSELREYIAFALGVTHCQDANSIDEIVRRSAAKPRFPCLIVTCNKEVLEDKHPESILAPGNLKEIDLTNMTVSWKPEVYEFYKKHPELFSQDHPALKLGKDRRIGRAATFFVDPSMYQLISQIPPEERIADLRLMTDAKDVALAILASASEPTYFPVVREPDPAKILTDGDYQFSDTIKTRSYLGGYIITMPAQDVRRMLPGVRVLGTGWRHNPLVARLLLKNWMLADCEEIALRSEWWADLEVNPDAEFESHIEFRDLTGQQEYEFGRRRAKELFSIDWGFPSFVKTPHFNYPATRAIAANFKTIDMYVSDSDMNGRKTLKTMRGLGPLYGEQPKLKRESATDNSVSLGRKLPINAPK